LGSGEQEDLALTSPPGLSHVDVQDPQGHTQKVAGRRREGNAEHRIIRRMQQVQNRVVRY
jgi:hypothetical protein